MSLYKRGGVWWIDLVHRGQRIRRSTSTPEKEAARQQHDELKARLWRQRLVSRHTWEDACREWLLEAQRDEADKYRLRAIKTSYQDRPLSEVTSASLHTAGAIGSIPIPPTRIRHLPLHPRLACAAKTPQDAPGRLKYGTGVPTATAAPPLPRAEAPARGEHGRLPEPTSRARRAPPPSRPRSDDGAA